MWIARHTGEDIAAKLKKLDVPGLGFIKTEQRVYPHAGLAAHILGFVGVDNQGLSGLEYKYDELLKDSLSKIILDGDPQGTR